MSLVLICHAPFLSFSFVNGWILCCTNNVNELFAE
jgi:hypothetical protein